MMKANPCQNIGISPVNILILPSPMCTCKKIFSVVGGTYCSLFSAELQKSLDRSFFVLMTKYGKTCQNERF